MQMTFVISWLSACKHEPADLSNKTFTTHWITPELLNWGLGCILISTPDDDIHLIAATFAEVSGITDTPHLEHF